MKIHTSLYLILSLMFLTQCNSSTDPDLKHELIAVNIKSTDVYEYRTGIAGDEDGASIIQQARHFEISEIIRNADTGWEPVYRYKPESGFFGSDYVELQLSTGSDGASPPKRIELIKIEFRVD